jgi:hypothetical protein
LDFGKTYILPTQGRKYRYELTVGVLKISGSTDPLGTTDERSLADFFMDLDSTEPGPVLPIRTHWLIF